MRDVVSECLYGVYIVVVSNVTYLLYVVVYFVVVYYVSGGCYTFCVIDVL